ncbi:MAG TPA: hypothetical protein VGW36_00710 [Pyrinomonadaceae bacterium]|nr:hypothetical protein [Pyrinomonadaceae bacterium]
MPNPLLRFVQDLPKGQTDWFEERQEFPVGFARQPGKHAILT